MWKAKLINVTYELDKTVDALKMTIELFDDTRSTEKSYIIYLDELSEVSLASLKAIVKADLDRLEKLDLVYGALSARIGLVI